MSIPTTCCFTGHRIILRKELYEIQRKLYFELTILIQKGVCEYSAGGALGFDTLAARMVIKLRDEYPEIKLTQVLPSKDQARAWSGTDKEIYKNILQQVDRM